ncbi:MAG: hypothetical protein ACREF6_02090 [Alphaproteobacteria bacterium]
MKTIRLIQGLVPIALAVAAIATPARVAAQATVDEAAISSYRLTADGLEKFTSATRELAALARKDPSAVAFANGTLPPAAARIFDSSGMSFEEWGVFVGAMFEASAAQYVLENSPDAAASMPMTEITKANLSFLEENQAAIDALGPDLRALQEAGEAS